MLGPEGARRRIEQMNENSECQVQIKSPFLREDIVLNKFLDLRLTQDLKILMPGKVLRQKIATLSLRLPSNFERVPWRRVEEGTWAFCPVSVTIW